MTAPEVHVAEQGRIAGRVAIVTGAASGIGRATLERFVREGANVVAADRDGAAVEEAVRACGSQAAAVAADVADPASVRALADAALERFARIDILAHFAGITRDGLYDKLTLEAWDAVIRVNLTGSFLIAQAVAPHLAERGGCIVLTSSRSYFGNVGQANYAASKGGVVSLTRTLALELGRSNVRVNAIAPGFVETPMTSVVPDKIRERAIAATPLRRVAAPEEIASVALFLASDDSSYMTGQVLCVDGGRTVGTAPA